jgi:HPt (histidine-containing phosphotransfer) domain-containing protein
MEIVIAAEPAPIDLVPEVQLVQVQGEVETAAEPVVLPPSEPAESAIDSVINLVAPEPEPETEFLLIGNEPQAEPWTAPAPAAPVVEVDPSLDPISPALLEQALTGGGFFTQYQIATFLREVPARIADIATAASRGDAGRANESLSGLRQLTGAVGAARIGAVVERMIEEIAAGRLEGAASGLGAIEHAFLDARQALEQASPHGLPADAPAIGNTFADQLSPSREGAGRALAQKLAASFVADAPKRVADLKLAVAEADGDAVQRVAQTFKGMCGLIGAEWLAKLVALAEADARLKRVTHAERYLDHIDLELGRVLANLERAQA